MAVGNLLAGQPQMQATLGQAMSPQAVASQAQPGGLGGLLAQIRQNPAAIQALLSTGANLLNPQTFGSPVGRIASAASQGVNEFTERTAAAEDKRFKQNLLERQDQREERKVGQGDRQLDIAEDELDLETDKLEAENEQFLQKLGLDKEQLAAQKKLWEAQAAKYAADARATREKAATGQSDNLTGEERIIMNLANIFMANEMPADQAYITAYDITKDAGKSKADAISGAVEKLGMLSSTDKGKEILNNVITLIDENYQSGSDILQRQKEQAQQQQQGQQEVAPGVTQGDIEAAITAINSDPSVNITWETLTEPQRANLIKKIQERKGVTQ